MSCAGISNAMDSMRCVRVAYFISDQNMAGAGRRSLVWYAEDGKSEGECLPEQRPGSEP